MLESRILVVQYCSTACKGRFPRATMTWQEGFKKLSDEWIHNEAVLILLHHVNLESKSTEYWCCKIKDHQQAHTAYLKTQIKKLRRLTVQYNYMLQQHPVEQQAIQAHKPEHGRNGMKWYEMNRCATSRRPDPSPELQLWLTLLKMQTKGQIELKLHNCIWWPNKTKQYLFQKLFQNRLRLSWRSFWNLFKH